MTQTETTSNSTEAPFPTTSQAEGLRPRVFFITVLLVFVADQLSKKWIVGSMSMGDSRPIFGQAFRLTLTHNTGGAWGLLPKGNGVFAVFAAVAIVALILAYDRVGRLDISVGAAFALAMGGAVGNLLDRVRLGYVVDFFDARIIHWPVFNIADSAISLSIVLLVLHFVRSSSPANDPGRAAAEAPIPTEHQA